VQLTSDEKTENWIVQHRASDQRGVESFAHGLRRHPDLALDWVFNAIKYLSTEEIWAYIAHKPNPWGNDNPALYNPYANAANCECSIEIDISTHGKQCRDTFRLDRNFCYHSAS
jgi:hypothetical protein